MLKTPKSCGTARMSWRRSARSTKQRKVIFKMAPPTKKQIEKGFHGFKTDDAEFLKPDSNGGMNPWDQGDYSDTGYNRRWNDSAGSRNYAGHGVDGANDTEAFCRPSQSETYG